MSLVVDIVKIELLAWNYIIRGLDALQLSITLLNYVSVFPNNL